ncbi:glycosyltransferase family 4 protein [Actinomycetospora chibensis]
MSHDTDSGRLSAAPRSDVQDFAARTGRVRVHMTGSAWFSATPGGLNRYFTDLYCALRSRSDVDVSAVAFGEPAPGGRSWGPVGGSTRRRVRASLVENPPLPHQAVVDRHFCLYGRPVVGRRGRHPVVVHFHGPWAAESRIAGSGEAAARAKYCLERIRYSGADRYVVLSTCFQDVLVDRYRVPPSRIRLIPPGVDLDRFRLLERSRSPSTMVLCVRRLERRMGVDVLLRSWPGVLASQPDARLVIVGTGSEEAALRAQVAESRLGGTVSFEGRVGDARLAQLYGESALTVVPSVALEGFGLIALESLAAGRAPVVTDCGGLPDSVRGLDPSLVVPAGDPDALANRLVDGLHGRVPGPRRCREHAETFSWQATAAQHVEMYTELLA